MEDSTPRGQHERGCTIQIESDAISEAGMIRSILHLFLCNEICHGSQSGKSHIHLHKEELR